MKKGLELPINMLVVIAIAVLILVVVAMFFTGFFGGGTTTLAFEPALYQACNNWKNVYNCASSGLENAKAMLKESGDETLTSYSVSQFCAVKLGYIKSVKDRMPTASNLLNECQALCGCPSQ